MSEVAYAERNLDNIKDRECRAEAYKKFMRVIKKDNKQGKIDNIVIYPEFKDKELLKSFINKLLWYFPNNQYSNYNIIIFYNNDFRMKELNDEEYTNQYNNYNNNGEHIKVYKETKREYFENADLILLNDINVIFDSILGRYLNKIFLVDKDFFSIMESSGFCNIFSRTLRKKEKNKILKKSQKNFELMEERKIKNSYVFCTGPSIDEVYNYNFKNGFKVICNSMVKNEKMMDHISPDLLVFADPVFHFGPSKYAQKFRDLMIKAIKKYDMYLAVPENKGYLLLAHFPELEEKIILVKSSKKFNFPEKDNISVKNTNNILTLLMLPFASSFTKDIYILGCDGRKNSDDYFWKHNSTVQFEGLMSTAFKMHPSFFRDRIYTNYYKNHCNVLADLISYGEKKDKSYYSLTKSYIPALEKRKKFVK